MIPPTELRIGNLVLRNGRAERLAAIDNKTMTIDIETTNENETGKFTLASIEPVPLSEDILQKCEFVYHEYFKFWQLLSRNDHQRSEVNIDRDYNVIDFMRRPLVKNLASLHQLQNIYFMLKGHELDVREVLRFAIKRAA